MDRFLSRSIVCVLVCLILLSVRTSHVFAASLPVQADASDPEQTDESKFDETFGRFGLSLGFQFNVLQTPAPINFYQDGIGGLGEISYGVITGVRILAGGGYIFNSPHVSPPQSGIVSPVSTSYAEGYVGGRLAMNPFFPKLFQHQPWVPYIRADVGGVGASVSGAGAQDGHFNGTMADAGVGIEGRAPEFPVGFFGEFRSQWFFFGSGTVTVLPVVVGTTFYF